MVNFRKGDPIFYQSDKSTDLYVVFRGKVRASLLNREGEEFVLDVFGEGDFFGEMSLLDGRPRSASAIANEDAALGFLRRDKFLETIKAEPMIAIEMLNALVHRLRKTDDVIGTLAFLDVSERLLKFFREIAKTEGKKDKDGLLKIKKQTHKELASRIGSSREAISKALRILWFKKLVSERDGYFLVSPDAGGLSEEKVSA
ncbi:MAG: Crp/Fnr family transcriptional regulator [Nitrospirae bacterium]|nr:MAG: Crp/Fnr family transcriptional regulator [Nitrospirota bacterium]